MPRASGRIVAAVRLGVRRFRLKPSRGQGSSLGLDKRRWPSPAERRWRDHSRAYIMIHSRTRARRRTFGSGRWRSSASLAASTPPRFVHHTFEAVRNGTISRRAPPAPSARGRHGRGNGSALISCPGRAVRLGRKLPHHCLVKDSVRPASIDLCATRPSISVAGGTVIPLVARWTFLRAVLFGARTTRRAINRSSLNAAGEVPGSIAGIGPRPRLDPRFGISSGVWLARIRPGVAGASRRNSPSSATTPPN